MKIGHQALAATNIPQAAKILADQYLQQPDIQKYLVGMGNLAIPQLIGFAEDGQMIAIKHLGEIATPEAARALVPLLWNKNEKIAVYTAVQLASLLPYPYIESALTIFPRSSLPKANHKWQGLWKPFGGYEDDSISVIAEQITKHLEEGTATKLLKEFHLPELDPRLVLPICIFSNEIFQKPSKEWSDTAQMFLENNIQETQLETISIELIQDVFKEQPIALKWEVLLATLPVRIQLDMLYRLSISRTPKLNDWQNLYISVTYDFRTSWHYRLVLTIAFLLSVLTVISAFMNSFKTTADWIPGSSIFIVISFWLVLWEGNDQPLEPHLFMSLGCWGPITFYREYLRLIFDQIVWNGTQSIFNTLISFKRTNFASFLTGSFAITGIFALVALVSNPENAGASTRFIAVIATVVGSGALAVAGVFGVTGNLSKVITSAIFGAFSIVLALAVNGTGYIAGSLIGALSGTGIGFWVRTRNSYYRFLAIFSAPFFFWLPIVLYFSSKVLIETLNLSVISIIVMWLGSISTCIILLRYGQEKERLAKNPLQNIVPRYSQ